MQHFLRRTLVRHNAIQPAILFDVDLQIRILLPDLLPYSYFKQWFMQFMQFYQQVEQLVMQLCQKNTNMKTVTLLLLSICFLTACNKTSPAKPQPPEEPAPTSLLLKEVVWSGLPSPFYRFEYDENKAVTKVQFASGHAMYDVLYNNGQVAELRNNTVANKDRLVYTYSNGRPAVIQYIDKNGINYQRCFLDYNSNGQLVRAEWELKAGNTGFVALRTLQFGYAANGNVSLVTTHHHGIEGRQPDILFTDRYEQYDNHINADGFALLHETDDHFVLLPGVVLQKNNPAKVTREGDGIHYEITYSYTYNDKKQPLTRSGIMHFTNSPDADDVQINTLFSYYE